jgi:hypothetical protein
VVVEFPHPAREFWRGESQLGSKARNTQSSITVGS